MADPIFRPEGAVPMVASDDVYSAPGEDWDGLPTKVAPSAGEIATGAVPNTPIDAEVRNWYDDKIARRLAAIDLVEATNFPEPAPTTGYLTVAGSGTGNVCEAAPGFEAGGILYSYQPTDKDVYRSNDGGYTWAVDYAGVAGANIRGVAASDASVACILDEAGTYKIAVVTPTQTWTSQAITGAFVLVGIAADLARLGGDPGYWLTGEKTAGADGAVYWYPEGDPPQTSVDMSPATSNGTPIFAIAVGHDRVLFADTRSVYTLARGDTNAAKTWDIPWTILTPYEVQSLVYDESSRLFYAFLWEGTVGSSRVYESSDGTTWTRKGAGTVLDACDLSTRRAFDTRGSVLVHPCTYNSLERILVSGDRGETWSLIPDPVMRHGLQTVVMGLAGRRLYCAGHSGITGDTAFAWGLRAGPLA